MRVPTLLPFGEGRVMRGSNRHTHPLDPLGSIEITAFFMLKL
jgi:hypothetical protein